jgi:lincosamide nucleotidyltransferase A/C/D/E
MELKCEMTLAHLVDLLHLFESAAIPVWLDGGWGVDALLQRQTRTHKDVDIILSLADVPRLEGLLALRGFVVERGKPPDSFVLANGSGLEVDVHAVTFDEEGNGLYLMENGERWIFPSEGFTGRGVVGEMQVKCLSPITQVLCHAYGYVPTEKDFRDMELLGERFGVEIPPQLQRKVAGSEES